MMIESDERPMLRGNPVELVQLRPFDLSAEETDVLAEREKILSDVRANYVNKEGQKLSDGGDKDDWAMIVGRFQPLQPGHSVLFETANIVAKNLLVVVGSANTIDEYNPFPPEDREFMIRKYYQERGFTGQLAVIYQDDLFGETPGSTDGEWGKQVLEKAEQGRVIDVVISNPESGWINTIFRSKHKRVYEVDMLKRNKFSATNKRAELAANGVIKPGVNHIVLHK